MGSKTRLLQALTGKTGVTSSAHSGTEAARRVDPKPTVSPHVGNAERTKTEASKTDSATLPRLCRIRALA